MRRSLFFVFACLALLFPATHGCSGGDSVVPGTVGGTSGDATVDGAATAYVGGGDAGNVGTFGGDDAGGSSDVHCSSDLHDVVDGNGHVVKTCPPDQGCAGGTCVEACESARANKSTIGCDYYTLNPDVISVGAGACFAAYVANTWSSPVAITVERDGQKLDLSRSAVIPSGNGQSITYAPLADGKLPPGQVAIVFLAFNDSGSAHDVACPGGTAAAYTAADGTLYGTGMGKAFHLTTSAPVVAYDIFPYGGGVSAFTGATLLMPTSAWGTNYVAVNGYRSGGAGLPSLDVIAQEDGTTVTLSPSAAIVGGAGVPASPAGKVATYKLDKGEYLQITQAVELTGTPIQADKPVALWGGMTCMNIDLDVGACDAAHQQIPPVTALGHEYVGVRYRNRVDSIEETPPWRIVGAVDGTELSYEPAPPNGAPTTLKSGEVAEFKAAGPFVVKSQGDKFPFYMSAHMTGCQTLQGVSDCLGDPEFVNVVPAQQYLASYVFFTDPTYPETNLVLVRGKAASGFQDVTLDCAGALGDWKPIGTSGQYEYTRIDLVRHDFAKQGNCDNGRHEIHSAAPFGLTVWGWGSGESGSFSTEAVSYAYPAGASVQPINTVIVPPTPR